MVRNQSVFYPMFCEIDAMITARQRPIWMVLVAEH